MLTFRLDQLSTGQSLQAEARRRGWRSRRPDTIAARLACEEQRSVLYFRHDDALRAHRPASNGRSTVQTYAPNEWRLYRR